MGSAAGRGGSPSPTPRSVSLQCTGWEMPWDLLCVTGLGVQTWAPIKSMSVFAFPEPPSPLQ